MTDYESDSAEGPRGAGLAALCEYGERVLRAVARQWREVSDDLDVNSDPALPTARIVAGAADILAEAITHAAQTLAAGQGEIQDHMAVNVARDIEQARNSAGDEAAFRAAELAAQGAAIVTDVLGDAADQADAAVGVASSRSEDAFHTPRFMVIYVAAALTTVRFTWAMRGRSDDATHAERLRDAAQVTRLEAGTIFGTARLEGSGGDDSSAALSTHEAGVLAAAAEILDIHAGGIEADRTAAARGVRGQHAIGLELAAVNIRLEEE